MPLTAPSRLYFDGTKYPILVASAVGGEFTSQTLPAPTPLLSFQVKSLADRVEVEALAKSFTTVAKNPLQMKMACQLDKAMKTATGDAAVVLGGAALWGMDLFNEIWNSIVFHATGFAPVWGTPMGIGDTALLILIGYNIEISFMFAMMGVVVCLTLPKDPKMKKVRARSQGKRGTWVHNRPAVRAEGPPLRRPGRSEAKPSAGLGPLAPQALKH